MNRYEITIEGYKITMVDTLTGDTYYGAWYVGADGKKYVKASDTLSCRMISKYWTNRDEQPAMTSEEIKKAVIEITKEIELVNLEGYIFEDEKGQTVAYPENTFGFVINNKFVADVCRSRGGSSLPLAYGRKIAREILRSGLVVQELAYCEPVDFY